jgi:site-specific recombinase XerD
MELCEAIKGYLLDGQVRGLTPKTLEWYRQKLQHFAMVLEQEQGITQLEQITPVYLRAFVLHMQQTKTDRNKSAKPTEEEPTISPLTIKGYVQVIKGFFAWCVAEEVVSSNPAQRLKLPKVPDYLITTFTPEQLQDMLAVCDTHTRLGFRDYTIMLLLLDTGIRVSELCGLAIEWVHEDYIKVFGKGRKEREVGISPEVRKLLWKYLAKYRRPASPEIREVFLNKRGQPLTPSGIEQLLHEIKVQAGIEGVRVSAHTFRHTFARMFLERGGEVYKLSRLMGHTDVKTTENYLKDFTSREARQQQARFSPVESLDLTKKTRGKKRGKKA